MKFLNSAFSELCKTHEPQVFSEYINKYIKLIFSFLGSTDSLIKGFTYIFNRIELQLFKNSSRSKPYPDTDLNEILTLLTELSLSSSHKISQILTICLQSPSTTLLSNPSYTKLDPQT
jgi:hypothetical protein